MDFPEEFIRRYKIIMKDEFSSFLKICRKKIRKTIVLNTLKDTNKKILEKLEKKNINVKEIFPDIYEITNSKEISKMREWEDGLFHSMESASTLPVFVLDPKENEKILDMTAAPGSKTFLISKKMKNTGLLIAIEKNKERMKGLLYNVSRLGLTNEISLLEDSIKFKSSFLFDKILLDAPCSSEAFVRKRIDSIKQWNVKNVLRKSKIQKELIKKASKLVKKDGIIVYSTCTLSPEENEEVVNTLLHDGKFKIEKTSIPFLKTRKGMIKWNGKNYKKEVENCIRIYPQDNNTFSFFIAKLRRIK